MAAITTESMRGLFDGDKAVACELSRAFYGVVLELKNQKLRTCMERLADWLLRANAKLGDKGQFTIPYDKRTLASRLGMTPENLSRNLRSLSDLGCVVIRDRNVTLGDPAALATIAGSVAPEQRSISRAFMPWALLLLPGRLLAHLFGSRASSQPSLNPVVC